MRQSRYLNVILTVNAVLLAGLLWTQLAGQPLLTSEAAAQSRSRYAKPATPAVNTQQRFDIDRALDNQIKAVQKIERLLQSGKIRVEVSNLREIRLEK